MKEKIENLKPITLDNNDKRLQTYLVSYQIIIEHFNKRKEEKYTHNDFISAILFAYSWMPTIPKICSKTLSELDKNIFHSPDTINSELEKLVVITNNSVVGLSKALHFMYPNDFPIWDSNIHKYLKGQKSNYGINKITNYIEYIELLKNSLNIISVKEKINKLKTSAKIELVSDMRAIELLIFLNSKNHFKIRNNV